MKPTVIGIRIREQRKRIGLTQAAMARELGISPAYLNLIESNKRSVGGGLLKRVASILDVNLQTLSGAAEQRLSDDLRALSADPLFDNVDPGENFAEEIIAKHPEWARMMLILYQAYLDRSRALSVMSDRLNRDTQLQTSVHRMLTHLTSIRSVSEILNDAEEIEINQRQRFHQLLQTESVELTNVAQELVSYFSTQKSTNPTAAVAEKVDEFIISRQNYFPELERASEELLKEIHNTGNNELDGALQEFLTEKLKIDIRNETISKDKGARYKNQSRMDKDNNTLFFLENAPVITRRFQMMRVASEVVCKQALEKIVSDPRLSSFAARHQAKRALASYIASAALMPYDFFMETAETHRYDIDVLQQKFNAGYEQVCHRLVTLRKPGAEGVPFAFMRADPSGYVSKRFPLTRFPLPRYGHVCPLWPIFSTFQFPGKIARNIAEFPNGDRFLMISRSVRKPPITFHDPPVSLAIMLVCDIIHGDRLVYSEGLDFKSQKNLLRVGPSCNQCAYAECQHRQESPWTLMDNGH